MRTCIVRTWARPFLAVLPCSTSMRRGLHSVVHSCRAHPLPVVCRVLLRTMRQRASRGVSPIPPALAGFSCFPMGDSVFGFWLSAISRERKVNLTLVNSPLGVQHFAWGSWQFSNRSIVLHGARPLFVSLCVHTCMWSHVLGKPNPRSSPSPAPAKAATPTPNACPPARHTMQPNRVRAREPRSVGDAGRCRCPLTLLTAVRRLCVGRLCVHGTAQVSKAPTIPSGILR
jgi:hypothetical protein